MMKVGTKYKSDVKLLSHESRRSYIALLGEVIKQIILLTGQEKGTDLVTIFTQPTFPTDMCLT
jgi:hypothetical protein